MSLQFLNQAFELDLKPSSSKFVLVALCNYANEMGEAYPSIAALCAKTGQNRKTVIKNLQYLSKRNLISDTKKNRGKTGQIAVWLIHIEKGENAPETSEEPPKNTDDKQTQERDGLTDPKTEPLNKDKEYRFYAETVPFLRGNSTKNGTRIHQDTSRTFSSGGSKPENTTVKNDFKPTQETRDWCVMRNTLEPTDDRIEDFILHHSTKGTVSADWQATFRAWMKKAKRIEASYAQPGQGRNNQTASPRGRIPLMEGL